MQAITKKNLLIFSVLTTLVFLFLIYLGTNICYDNGTCRALRRNLLHDSQIFTVIFPILLFFSAITYPLSEVVFTAWKKFAIWATPITVALTIWITSLEGGDFYGFDPGFDLALMSLFFILYFLTSIIIIFRAWRKERKGQKEEN